MNLADVIRTESTNRIKEIIKDKGLPINSKWSDYEALNTAIKCQRRDIAKFLIGKKCRVNKISQPPDRSNSPLHNAVLLGDVELVHELLQNGALTSAVNGSGNTPLHVAFLDKHNDMVNLILASIQKNQKSVNLKNNQGLSHMHIACTTKNLKVVENFIAAGVDIQDSVNDDSLAWPGFTALHFAADFKSHEVVKILMNAGANLDIENANYQTPLQLANNNIIDLAMTVDALSKKKNSHGLLSSIEHMSYFHMACLRNDSTIVKKYIDKGAEIDTPIISTSGCFAGCSALHFAVMAEQEQNIKLLLKYGAKIYNIDSNRMAPFHYALYKRNEEKKKAMVDLLHEATWDELEDFEDKYGLGQFHLAIMRNKLDLVKEFVCDDRKYLVNWPLAEDTPEYPSYYPLHFAARYEHVKMAALLMKLGADVNKVSRHGTPLHMAFQSGNLELIKLFWNNGADVKLLRPKDKKTMLHLLVESFVAKKRSNTERGELLKYVERLVSMGVDVNAKTEILNDDDGDTALHFACSQLYLGSPCIKLLLDLGANINLKNTEDFTPLPIIPNTGIWIYPDKYQNNAADFMMLYHHVQKLKALGCEVDPDNEKYYCKRLMKIKNTWDENAEEFKDETIKRLEQERFNEIKRLKTISLTKTTSLYDFLILDAKSVTAYANNERLKKIIESKNLDKDFSLYRYLILLQYQKAISGVNVGRSVKRAIDSTTPDNSSKRHRLE